MKKTLPRFLSTTLAALAIASSPAMAADETPSPSTATQNAAGAITTNQTVTVIALSVLVAATLLSGSTGSR